MVRSASGRAPQYPTTLRACSARAVPPRHLDARPQDSGRRGRYSGYALAARRERGGGGETWIVVPRLDGAGRTWREPRILGLAKLPAVSHLRVARPRPGRAAHEHTSDYQSAYANIVSIGHQGKAHQLQSVIPHHGV
jgi:hypothetical protein